MREENGRILGFSFLDMLPPQLPHPAFQPTSCGSFCLTSLVWARSKPRRPRRPRAPWRSTRTTGSRGHTTRCRSGAGRQHLRRPRHMAAQVLGGSGTRGVQGGGCGSMRRRRRQGMMCAGLSDGTGAAIAGRVCALVTERFWPNCEFAAQAGLAARAVGMTSASAAASNPGAVASNSWCLLGCSFLFGLPPAALTGGVTP